LKYIDADALSAGRMK